MGDAELGQAYAARRSGNVATAVEICRRLIAADPPNHAARSLLGLCFAEAGRVDHARPLIEDACAAEPGNWRFLLNLSVLRELEGRAEDAIALARVATANAPERFEAWGRLGHLCGKAEDFDEAAAALEKAVALEPHDPGMAMLLAAAACDAGRLELAERALKIVERQNPGGADALRLRTHLARRRGEEDAFLDAAGRWLAADPRSDEARVALAHGQAQRDDFHAAAETYRPLVTAYPGNADHAATYAQYLLWSRDFAGAETYYSRALERQPGHSAAAAGLARLHVFKGDFDRAAGLARTALEADPRNVDAFAQLAIAADSRLSDDDLARLQRLAQDSSEEPERRAIAWFTLGDVHHRRREHGRAFEAWSRANALKRAVAAQSARWRYDRLATEKSVDRLIVCFGAPIASDLPARSEPTPLFIVGMPRAGTTLLDSALAAHPEVASGGELPGMPALLNRFLAWAEGAGWSGGAIPDSILRQLREAYLRQFRTYRIEDARFVTDKQPLNFLSVGLIRQLFPDSPIIHIRRDPIETGFSIFRNNFTKSWPFSTALEDIGHYYGQYARMMRHWESAFGEQLASVRYEALVQDFESELRRLLGTAQLDWNAACLNYFQRDSIVTTLSSAQVRKPPSKELMSSAEPYRKSLRPLREALEKSGAEAHR